jgi:hypothetical protein
MLKTKRQIAHYIKQLTRYMLEVAEEAPQRHHYIETLQHDIDDEISRIKAEIRAVMPDNPVLSGCKVFSQVDEDGIIHALIDRLPPEQLSRTAIEIGCGNGLENNTHFLLLNGFRVCWLDGAPENIAFIRRELGISEDRKARLMVRENFVTRENIAGLIREFCEFLGTSEPDVFSLDIDGNDLHILEKALAEFSPKIICVEYNSKFPPPTNLSIKYNSEHQWKNDDYHGASLQAFCDFLSGYFLVCCNISGANAFFIKNEFRTLFSIYPPSALFRPFRSHLRLLSSGHPPSLKWLRDALQ